MKCDSAMNYLTKLSNYTKAGILPPDLVANLKQWYASYTEAAREAGSGHERIESLMVQFLDLVVEQIQHPFEFEPYHQKVTSPIDYYHFGLNFIRSLVIHEESKALNLEYADQIERLLADGENAILFANHQIEADPQAISLLLENTHPKLAEEMIIVAGQRVITDPMAVPLSKGCNLLCIYSKKYIHDHPELKEEKIKHNQRTMKRMGQLLSEGGKCIYVAPSGGRDRPNRNGHVEVAPFDPQSIELFWLIAKNAERPTHFYPLSLATYDLLPPPDSVKKKIGEPRHTKATPIFLAFGSEIDMENFPGSDVADKKAKRDLRARYIWEQVVRNYSLIA